ncbi:MAG TPA: bifunctional riboflavin kinase/FAD synthetase [Patescibacteria group bacterium]|nr:bifunctional riboflavin kinase/FAD synthetase [Patescibacteria group bacterium]
MIKLHNNLNDIPAEARGSVCVIGNFDGLHLGHRALIAQAQKLADEKQLPLSVLTFEPHPREFFKPDGPPFRLTLLPAKARLLDELGVAHLFVAAFDASLAGLTATAFIDRILVGALGASHVFVGRDFGFGQGRAGNVALLQADGRFGVTAVAPVTCDGDEVYSSTRIRALLQEGKLDAAAALLGRNFEIEMPVVHGDKRGRTIGFPTANQQAGRHLRLPFGIYAVKVLIEGENGWRDGVANFGIRPMFRIDQPIFETYIFGFDGDIYGKNMRVQPVQYLRGEQNFSGLEALMAQIKQDCMDAAAVLKSSSL